MPTKQCHVGPRWRGCGEEMWRGEEGSGVCGGGEWDGRVEVWDVAGCQSRRRCRGVLRGREAWRGCRRRYGRVYCSGARGCEVSIIWRRMRWTKKKDTGSEKERGERRRDQVWRDTCSGYRALCVRVCVRQVWSPKRTFAVTPAAMASANAVVFHSSGLRLAATWQADMASKRRSRGISVRSFTTLVSCFAAFFFFVGIAVMEQRSAGTTSC